MRALIAFDKFKDALSAPEACERAAAALRAVRPSWQLDLCPFTDGGEGFARILTTVAGGERRVVRVTGPRGAPVEAGFGLVEGTRIPEAARALLELPAGRRLAVIEMAEASGLALLPPAERDPWQTTTYGTGELLQHAVEAGAEAILLGVGGSATHDLALGALAALGWRFLDASGQAVARPTPAQWTKIVRIDGGPGAALPPIRIACDVTNPLLGPHGAAAVYSPQKGLREADRPALEAESARLAALLCAHSGRPASLVDASGAGAAGGCAFGLMAATGARLLPGSAFVAAWLDLARRLADADLVLTGEGRFDESSLAGKGPGAIAAQALALGKTVHVFAGAVATLPPRAELHTHALSPAGLPLAQALQETGWRLQRAVGNAFKPTTS
jgi:glycerate kinase